MFDFLIIEIRLTILEISSFPSEVDCIVVVVAMFCGNESEDVVLRATTRVRRCKFGRALAGVCTSELRKKYRNPPTDDGDMAV